MHEFIKDVWESLPDAVKAGIVAFIISLVRVYYDQDERSIMKKLLEMMLCGFIAMGTANFIEAMGLNNGWSIFLASAVGLYGVDEVRKFGKRFGIRVTRNIK